MQTRMHARKWTHTRTRNVNFKEQKRKKEDTGKSEVQPMEESLQRPEKDKVQLLHINSLSRLD